MGYNIKAVQQKHKKSVTEELPRRGEGSLIKEK